MGMSIVCLLLITLLILIQKNKHNIMTITKAESNKTMVDSLPFPHLISEPGVKSTKNKTIILLHGVGVTKRICFVFQISCLMIFT